MGCARSLRVPRRRPVSQRGGISTDPARSWHWHRVADRSHGPVECYRRNRHGGLRRTARLRLARARRGPSAGIFDSPFFRGSGPDKSPVAYRDVLLRSSEKLRIQLPVALFRFGMFTNSVYTFFDAKIISGFAPGASVAKSGGPVRSASSSLSPFGSGRVINLREGATIFPPPPETFVTGLPPLMLMPTALVPGALPAAVLPCGGSTGAGGAGLAESAISALSPPLAAVNCVALTSGAGPASPDCAFCATRGAAPAFNSSLGRAGPLCAAGRLMS